MVRRNKNNENSKNIKIEGHAHRDELGGRATTKIQAKNNDCVCSIVIFKKDFILQKK